MKAKFIWVASSVALQRSYIYTGLGVVIGRQLSGLI